MIFSEAFESHRAYCWFEKDFKLSMFLVSCVWKILSLYFMLISWCSCVYARKP